MTEPHGARSGAAVRVLLGAGMVGAAGAGIGVARHLAGRRHRAEATPTPEPDPVPALRLRPAFPEAQDAGQALRDAGLTVAVAESCTGGLLGAALTALPGSSEYVAGGVIAYSDEVKRTLLAVPSEVLRREGAVSEPTAVAMAEGVRAVLGASVGVSITGIAGPAADGSSKPVGLVYVCVAGPGLERAVQVIHRDRGREANRAEAVHTALRMLRDAAAGRPGPEERR